MQSMASGTDAPERLYEVWLLAGGEPERIVAKFRRFDDAKRYCQQHATQGGFDVKMPNGRWYGTRRTEPVVNPDDFSDKVPG